MRAALLWQSPRRFGRGDTCSVETRASLAHFPSAGVLVVDNDTRVDLGFNEWKIFLAVHARKLLRQSASNRVATFRAHNVPHTSAARNAASWLSALHKWILPRVGFSWSLRCSWTPAAKDLFPFVPSVSRQFKRKSYEGRKRNDYPDSDYRVGYFAEHIEHARDSTTGRRGVPLDHSRKLAVSSRRWQVRFCWLS
jgi:hypothetical protein